ncbi:MFS family permease [Amycolatopsis bartoniae]|uniref:MFS transporter n=1 Tax=Amycolatopsis bartoniae TaxID=941986 RepID=A0A8H9J2U1_9PSEU|nr:MFS transporter [Amycolatopsis bartoniae]MBB2940193.1 MFS family permease [Amycolatopsis bartoniae]TVT11286.1 MFS transporter [Amycolatopsis bartoniae]GHF66306.1 MFS transporter [Amycolatopsis bartoniae]
MHHIAPPGPKARSQVSWHPLVAACLGTFLLLLHTTIVTVALPAIATDLHAGFSAQQWVVDVFTVALAGLLLGLGSLSDNLGRRRVYLSGLAGFGVATLACGLAVSATMLIVARAVQGIAGAAMFATILPLVGLTYEGQRRARAFAVWGTVSGIASAAGTFSGGIIAQFLGWRWIFFLSLPLCGAAIVLSTRHLEESPRTGGSTNPWAVLSFSLAAAGLTAAVITGGDQGWSTPATVTGLTVAALSATAFVATQRWSTTPMLPPALFATRRFTGVLVIAFGYYFAAFGWLPVGSLWLQETTGLGPALTSVALALQVVVFFLTSAVLSGRFHTLAPSGVLGGFTVLIGAGCLTALLSTLAPSWLALVPAFVLTGIGAGIVSPVFPAVAIAAVPEAFGGTAGAAANSARQLGLALGVALAGTIFTAGQGDTHDTTNGLTAVMTACGATALVTGALGAWLLRKPRLPSGTE